MALHEPIEKEMMMKGDDDELRDKE